MALPQLTDPPQKDQLAAEDITWVFDCTELLAGDTIASVVSSTLTAGSTVIALVDAASFVGVNVFQRIRAGILEAGSLYRLVVVVNPAGSSNELATVLQISCPF